MSENGVTQTRDFARIRAAIEPEVTRLLGLYPEKRSALLPILHAFQNIEGWVSPEALAATAEIVGEPLSVVESTASFYTLFFRKPVGKYMVQVCRNLSCIIGGAEEVMQHCRKQLGVDHLETTSDGVFSYEEVECLAACDRAPCMQVNLEFFYDLTKEKIDDMFAAMRSGTFAVPPLPQTVFPDHRWHAEQDVYAKSPGAQNVEAPNAPGGIGDPSGARMIERLRTDPYPLIVRPTSERAVLPNQDVLPETQL